MKTTPTILCVLCAFVVNLFTACGLQPRVSDPLDIAVTGVATLSLRNNPDYRPLVLDFTARIDEMVARGYTSGAHVDEFLRGLGEKYPKLTLEDLDKLRAIIDEVRAIFPLIFQGEFPLDAPITLSEDHKAFLIRVKTDIIVASGLSLVLEK